MPDDRSRERNQSRFAERLGQRLFGQRAANPAVAIFERMDAHEGEMSQPGPGQSGHLSRVRSYQPMKRSISVIIKWDGGAS